MIYCRIASTFFPIEIQLVLTWLTDSGQYMFFPI